MSGRNYHDRRAQGLCVDCGIPVEDPKTMARCPDCRRRHTEATSRYNARKKARKMAEERKQDLTGVNWKDRAGHWVTYVEEVPRERDGTPISCRGCYHRQIFHGWSICVYSSDMGRPRGCPVAECHYYRQSPEGRRHKLETTAQKEERELWEKWS